jgi:hypothetical protein
MVITPMAWACVMPRSAAMSWAARRSGSVSGPSARPTDHLGQEPLPGVRGELPGDQVQRGAPGLAGLAAVAVQVGVGVTGRATALDRGQRGPPGGQAGRVPGGQHDHHRGAHSGGQRGLHLRRGRQAEHVKYVAGFAGQALDMRAGPAQRDDRDEEDGEEAPPGPLPVLPVTAALPAVENALPEGAVKVLEPKNDQHHGPLFVALFDPTKGFRSQPGTAGWRPNRDIAPCLRYLADPARVTGGRSFPPALPGRPRAAPAQAPVPGHLPARPRWPKRARSSDSAVSLWSPVTTN